MVEQKKLSESFKDNKNDKSDSRIQRTEVRTTQQFASDGRSEPSDHLSGIETEIELASDNELSSKDKTADFECNEKNRKFNSIFGIEELTSDDEIYTFQGPENCINQTLCGQSIDFTNPKQSITQGDCLYELEFLKSSKEDIIVAFPNKTSSGTLTVLPLKGHILLQKVMDIHVHDFKTESDTSNNQDVNFPDDIKVRHPLLGVDWKAHIDLANKSFANENSLRKTPRKSKGVLRNEVLSPKNLKRKGTELETVVSIKKEKVASD